MAPENEANMKQELNVIKKYSLRWSILAAWWEDLNKRHTPLSSNVFNKLEASRIKISSACYSSCEIGCELVDIEAELTSADSSSQDNQTNQWIDLLGAAMDDSIPTMKLLNYSPVNFYYNNCSLRSCSCKTN